MVTPVASECGHTLYYVIRLFLGPFSEAESILFAFTSDLYIPPRLVPLQIATGVSFPLATLLI